MWLGRTLKNIDSITFFNFSGYNSHFVNFPLRDSQSSTETTNVSGELQTNESSVRIHDQHSQLLLVGGS